MANSAGVLKRDAYPFLPIVEELYGIQVEDCEGVRAVWKLVTQQGVFALKKVNHSKEKMMFMYQATEHLWRQGFTSFARFVPTLQGQPFFERDGGIYFLTHWLHGRESDLQDRKELKQAAQLMARMHHASQGFVPTIEAKMKTRWAGWIERFENELQDIVTQKLRISEIPEDQWTDLERTFMETVEPMLEMAETGVKLLKESDYPQVLGRARKLRGFIHGDFTYHNFIRSDDGNMSLVDFDFCAFELRVHDMARFMRKMLRRTHWDVETGLSILSDYHAVFPLYKDELEILRSVLYFPQRYWRAVERGFISGRYLPQNAAKKMREEVADISQWHSFMEQFPAQL